MQVSYSKMELELIQGCINNDRLAQKRMYERYYGKMMGVCMRYANSKDEACEMLNMGFFKVFKTIGGFKTENGNLEGWIYRIMVNTAIDYLRKELKHQHTDIEKTVYAEDSSNVIADLTAEQILSLVNKLTPAYRTVFNLYVVEGYSHKEIGEMLGINEGTSKSNLAKARAKMQDMIIQLNKVNLKAYGE